jgi:hypothetical protein
MTPVNRYLNVWRQLCAIPVPDRPTDLRQEMDRIWEELTPSDKNELGKVLEADT